MIRLLVASAVGLFVLSLPLAKTETGAWLRRAAAVCLALALLPSVIGGLFFRNTTLPETSASVPPSVWEQLTGGLSCVGALVLLSIIAYAVLTIRKKLHKPKKEPWELLFSRSGGKRRVDHIDDDDDFFGGFR